MTEPGQGCEHSEFTVAPKRYGSTVVSNVYSRDYRPEVVSEPPAAASEGIMMTKESNPKAAVGVRQVPFHVIPMGVMGELGVAMLEGARKYGSHNYRTVGVRGSVYFDALHRHMAAWWEGQDEDPDSGLSHITKAIATLVVLRDAEMNSKLTDDRPPKMQNRDWVKDLNEAAKAVIERYPDAKEPHVALLQ